MARELQQWLNKLGFSRYLDLFVEQEITFDRLTLLDRHDLQELGIPIGPRKQLLAEIEALRVAQQAAPERRQVSLLLCDLVDSTMLAAQLDPEDLRILMRRYQDAVSQAIRLYDGYVARIVGDGVLAYFGWPSADERQAERAVRAGLDAAAAVAAITSQGRPLSARVGIATGEVVIGDAAGNPNDIAGDAPNLAARLQAHAAPGQVVINELTWQLVQNVFSADALGALNLKGFAKPLLAYAVHAINGEAGQTEKASIEHPIPLIGRTQELSLLMENWRRASYGAGQVMLIKGEAGVGKSRLLRAFANELEIGSFRHLRYKCSPYSRSTPLHPVTHRIENAAGFLNTDSNQQKFEKLERLYNGDDINRLRLHAATLSLPYAERYGAFDITPKERKERILEFHQQHLLTLSRTQPILCELEDAHWLDPTTLELLQRVAQKISNAPILLLISHRPQWRPPVFLQELAAEINLAPLPLEQATMLAQHVAGRANADNIDSEIVERADGIPLFIEELTKAVIAGANHADAIPSSLQASLTARLDQIGSAREVAQLGAVIGRDFSLDQLSALSGVNRKSVTAALARLEEAELIRSVGQPAEARFRFRHALIQDAAYQSLLKQERRRLHAMLAHLLEEEVSQGRAVRPEMIAQHLFAANRHEAAITYYEAAARDAQERYAHREASDILSQALQALEKLPKTSVRQRMRRQLSRAMAHSTRLGFSYADESLFTLFRGDALWASSTNDLADETMALTNIGNVHSNRGEYDEATRVFEKTERRLVHADANDDRIKKVQVFHHSVSAFNNIYLGRLSEAKASYCALLSNEALVGMAGTEATAKTYRALVDAYLGFPEDALAAAQECFNNAAQAPTPHFRSHTGTVLTTIQRFYYPPHIAIRTARRFHENIKDNDESNFSPVAKFQLGDIMRRAGQQDTAIEILRDALAEMAESGLLLMQIAALEALARALTATGALDRALPCLNQAFRLVEERNERIWQASLLQAKALWLMEAEHGSAEVEDCFVGALAVARAQKARLFELNTACSYAQFLMKHNRPHHALAALKPAYDWFGQGFDTVPLQEARSVLETLEALDFSPVRLIKS